MDQKLSKKQLQEATDKIVSDYEKVINNELPLEKAQKSISFIIGQLQKYEIEGSLYPARSVTLLPKSSYLLDLLLIYDSEIGEIKYRLTIRRHDKKYDIETNTITPYSEELCPPRSDSRINCNIPRNASLGTTHRRKRAPLEMKDTTKTKNTRIGALEESKNSPPTESKPRKSPPEVLPKFVKYVCPSRDVLCCYLSSHHVTPCQGCCYDSEHYHA